MKLCVFLTIVYTLFEMITYFDFYNAYWNDILPTIYLICSMSILQKAILRFMSIIYLGKEVLLYFVLFIILCSVVARIAFMTIAGYNDGSSDSIFTYNFESTANSFYSIIDLTFIMESTHTASNMFVAQLTYLIFYWVIVGILIKFMINPILVGGFYSQYINLFMNELLEIKEKYPDLNAILDVEVNNNRIQKSNLVNIVHKYFNQQ